MSTSIVELICRHAENQPEKLCLVDETQSVTYAQYAEKAKKLAEVFRKQGIGRTDRVVIEATQTIDYLAMELALHLLGAIFVPVERNCAKEKIISIAARSEARFIVTLNGLQSEIYPNCAYAQILELAQQSDMLDPITFPNSEDISEILFSTGTTGKEKGIVLTHDNDIALAENVIYGVAMKEDNVELIPSPLNHSHGLRRYYANMLMGSTVVLLTGVMNVPLFFNNIEKYHVNSIDLVPTALSVILRLSKNKLAEYRGQLRYIQLGAAPLMEADKEKLKEMLPFTHLFNFYGSTESGCISIYDFNRPDDKKNCIGKPTYNANIVIVDDDRQIIRSSEQNSGFLASRGRMNMVGYWRDMEETEKTLIDGYVFSNDEAYFDEDGDIILLGRKGDVINVGGNKVSPEEIENAAKQMHGIADCGCISVPDEMKGHVPKLYVQMEANVSFDSVAIRAWLANNLESYKVPKYIEQIKKIPRSYNGKLLRRELRN
ncbi:MAG: class I adenylate-forming enzyme family protein [Acetivibrionales bacterium]|jgi:acyl-coenzyme A synthetase/AMP-(fatty) acid ligase